jgi:hypothetical protein
MSLQNVVFGIILGIKNENKPEYSLAILKNKLPLRYGTVIVI